MPIRTVTILVSDKHGLVGNPINSPNRRRTHPRLSAVSLLPRRDRMRESFSKLAAFCTLV